MTHFAGSIWVDVEDFFDYFIFNPRPSGIQRLAFEIKRELQRLAGDRVRFVRRGAGASLLREVAWADVQAMFEADPTPRKTPRAAEARVAERLRAKQLIAALPSSLREPLFQAAVRQSQAVRNWRELARALRGRKPQAIRADPPAPELQHDAFKDLVRPGDCFLVLGAPWAVPGFADLAAELKQRYGMTVALLLYDLIPARHPEWCTPHAVALFDTWLHATLPLCDRLMAISRHTARDVEAYARERGVALAGPVHPIPVGSGFGMVETGEAAGLPAPGSYVLFVSTLEARKNHALAVRVWRKLADEVRTGQRSVDSVPYLVFAGRVGWLVADLMEQLDNMAWLGGRIRLIRDPTDAELVTLYRGCLFTFFPSLFEGWGLPVSESLALGTPCLSSNATALPEAGGALCRYFDPEDLGSAHKAVAALLDDRAGLAAWREQVREGFRPSPWGGSAEAVLEHVRADAP